MDDQLDNDLRNRIKEVFDNYEDTNADGGWLLLREKYPEKAKRRAIAWIWWGAAALLLLFLGIALFLNKTEVNKPQLTYKKYIKPNRNETADNMTKSNQTGKKRTDGTAFLQVKPLKDSTTINRQKNARQRYSIVNGNNGNAAKTTRNKSIGRNHTVLKQTAADTMITNNQMNGVQLNAFNKSSLPFTTPANKLLSDTDKAKYKTLPSSSTTKTPDQPNRGSIYSLFENDKGPVNKENKKKDEKVKFSIYAATYFNYAKGSDNQINGGAGVTSDISLSRNFKLSTGLAITQNSLSYNSTPPAVSVKTYSVAAAAAFFGINSASQSAFNIASPTFKNYNASLVALDIPVNLKFMLNPSRSDAFFSAGLSSGTFANETYVFRYNNPAFFNATGSQIQDETTHNSFSSFYFANTLNLSFGVGYPVGKYNRLIIEPFLKYPLEGLGSQQIRFGAGGLNLKFNFEPKKK